VTCPSGCDLQDVLPHFHLVRGLSKTGLEPQSLDVAPSTWHVSKDMIYRYETKILAVSVTRKETAPYLTIGQRLFEIKHGKRKRPTNPIPETKIVLFLTAI
jgi:hypothetical protein